MKKLLKSLMVLGVVISTVAGATAAYFTTTVTATDNQITTGTLLLGLASSARHDVVAGDGYWVAQDVDGVDTPISPFEAWINAQPGTYLAYSDEAGTDTDDAGNTSRWVAVVNRGSLPVQYRAVAVGAWTILPRISSDPANCGGLGSGDASLVQISNIRRYANGGAVPACLSHEECQNVRNWLTALGYTTTTSSATETGPVSGYFDESASVTLQPKEFQIYRVDLNLDSATDNCYQGATYEYDMQVQGKQVNAPSF
ncbi:MAG: hypothetical protein V1487_02160 [bacterium]